MNIFIEGNIGSGKTTLLSKIKESNIFEKYDIIYEPIDEWINTGIFEIYNKDPKRWGFTFQINAITTRYKNIMEMKKKNDNLIIERSGYADRFCFMNVMKDCDYINHTEISIYDNFYSDIINNLYPMGNSKYKVVYLNVSSEECLNRINKRSRNSESSLKIDYIKKIEEYHIHNLIPYFENLKIDVLKLDVSKPYHKNEIETKNVLNNIFDFINK